MSLSLNGLILFQTWKSFNRFEINRIPLIVGDQFEMLPTVITEIKEFNTPIIAVLRQQLWDEQIKSLSICSVNLKKKTNHIVLI